MEDFFEGLKTFDAGMPEPEELLSSNNLKGFTHSEDTIERMKVAATERMKVVGAREKISNTLKGRPFTDERKANVSSGLYKQKFSKYAKMYKFEWKGQTIEEFNTLRQIAKKYNIPHATLAQTLKRRAGIPIRKNK